jgi:hypothetical protein
MLDLTGGRSCFISLENIRFPSRKKKDLDTQPPIPLLSPKTDNYVLKGKIL